MQEMINFYLLGIEDCKQGLPVKSYMPSDYYRGFNTQLEALILLGYYRGYYTQETKMKKEEKSV